MRQAGDLEELSPIQAGVAWKASSPMWKGRKAGRRARLYVSEWRRRLFRRRSRLT